MHIHLGARTGLVALLGALAAGGPVVRSHSLAEMPARSWAGAKNT